MNTIKDGGTAFPCDRITSSANALTSSTGMSMRDYFAAKAMHQFLDGAVLPKGYDASDGFASLAARAYEMADAMIRAREVTA
jgi:hypothetical protein